MSTQSDRVVLPTDVIPIHYTLEITPYLPSKYDANISKASKNVTFSCLENIKVKVLREGVKSFSLHARDINIQKVSFQGQTAIEISYNTKYHTVTFVFEKDFVVNGDSSVDIEYEGILNSDMAGFYKSTYVDAEGVKKYMGSTQFEPLDARRAFPCWDEPARKATFTVILIVDSHLTAISNMPETEVMYLPGLKKKVTFAISPIMSTYLVAWAVGEFDIVSAVTKGGVDVRVFCQPGRAAQGKFALNVGVASLDFFDDFFNIRYPLPKLDMISIPEFAMGAMENWGLVTYRENALMIDEVKASTQMKQRVASVIAHELAHQWFGNLVTMTWWDGLWLNEGFASFMQDFAVDAIFPEYKIWEQWTIDSLGAAQRLDSLRSSHPIIVPIKHAEEVEQVFDAISYSKGSTVVNMIFNTLGYENFQKGLQIYFKRHAYGNTETNDLWNAWTEASGINVSELMHLWTTRLGYPYLSVTSEKWTNEAVEITLKQTWFLADGSLTEDEKAATNAPVWHVPLFFATSSSVSESAVIMTNLEQSFTIPVSGTGDFLKINAGQKALCRVLHSSEQLDRLCTAISASLLSDVDVASLLLDNYALVKANIAPIENVVKVLKAIKPTTSYIIWSSMGGIFSALSLQLEAIGESALTEFHEFAKTKVLATLRLIGWDSKSSDSHTDKLLRSTIVNLLDVFAYNDEEVLLEARSRFNRHFEDPTVLPSEYKTTVYKLVLLNGGDKEYSQILNTFYATEDNQEKKYALLSLGATGLTSLKLKTLDWATKSGDVKLQDFFYAYGVVAASRGGATIAWNYYKENFLVIKEKLSRASPSLMDAVIVNSIGRFITDSQASEVESFFVSNPLPSSSRRISQQLELIRSNARLFDIVKNSELTKSPIAIWRG